MRRALIALTLLGLVVAAGASKGTGFSHRGVEYWVEPERAYWKYYFKYNGERYEVLDFQTHNEAHAAAMAAIDALTGAG